jgi:hypothetical protein
MRGVLLLAGIYNLAWGAAVIVFPVASYRWCGFPDSQASMPLWQCLGMIVGVYGIGYAIAAFDPVRHWPVVLVGLLGKVLGPIGMVHAIWNGTLPMTAGRTCLFNDLIWWIPFGLILAYAWRRHSSLSGALPSES